MIGKGRKRRDRDREIEKERERDGEGAQQSLNVLLNMSSTHSDWLSHGSILIMFAFHTND